MTDASTKTPPANPALHETPSPWPGVAVAVLVLAALAATFTYEQDFDAFWHLKAGQWMLDNQRVLNYDPFTSEPEAPGAPWVNVYWLFQLVLAGTHRIGGFAALSALKALCAAAAVLAMGISLRKHVPAAWLILVGLVTIAVLAERVRVRPEMFTLLFLMLSVVLVDEVRRGGSPRRLWWLVPMMLAWINMHGLYFLGLVVIWMGMLGAVIDRWLGRKDLCGNLPTQAALAPMLAATAACLISPWPLESILHPLVLWTRISSQGDYYVYGVSELQRTWEALPHHLPAVALACGMTLVMLIRIRKVPVGHVLWAVPFIVLALLARRNVGLAGPVCGYLLALHGGEMLRSAGQIKPALGRLAAPAAALCVLLGLGATAGYATSYIFRVQKNNDQFGAGLGPHHYCESLAKYMGTLTAKGDILTLSFGDASTFMYYSYPTHKVWMDGRLEIHSTERFKRMYQILTDLRSPLSASEANLPRSVRFLVARYDDRHLSALMNAPSRDGAGRRFKLIQFDSVAACFADTDATHMSNSDWAAGRPAAEVAAELPLSPNLKDFDQPLYEDGLMDNMPASPRRWYRQNPVSMYARLGSLTLSLGEMSRYSDPAESQLQRRLTLVAVRAYEAARREGTLGELLDNNLLAQALGQWSRQNGETATGATPVDVNLARSLYLSGKINLAAAPPEQVFTLGLMRIQTLLQGRHLEAAAKETEALGSLLPARQRLTPPQEYVDLRGSLAAKLEPSRERQNAMSTQPLPIAKRIAALASPEMGLTDQAIKELKDLKSRGRPDAAACMMLGDLLLRQGRVAEARDEYAIASTGGDETELALRQGLCQWVEGDHYAAIASFVKIVNEKNHSVTRFYLGLLLEEVGRHNEARAALQPLASPIVGKDLETKARAALARLDQP